jgi:hypothetical protein
VNNEQKSPLVILKITDCVTADPTFPCVIVMGGTWIEAGGGVLITPLGPYQFEVQLTPPQK